MADTAAFMYPEFLTSFIEAYKQQPCLWNMKSTYYGNKSKREDALKALVNFTRQTIPDVNLDFVKKRIEILRGSFRKEFNKVRKSIRSGGGRVHVPKLWYYDLMLFVADQQDQQHGGKYPQVEEEEISLEDGFNFSQIKEVSSIYLDN